MEQILEENDKLRSLDGLVEKSKPVELKQTLQFPKDIAIMLGHGEESASVLNITTIHMFETAPQEKCAIAYEIVSPREDLGIIYLIIVYAVAAN